MFLRSLLWRFNDRVYGDLGLAILHQQAHGRRAGVLVLPGLYRPHKRAEEKCRNGNADGNQDKNNGHAASLKAATAGSEWALSENARRAAQVVMPQANATTVT